MLISGGNAGRRRLTVVALAVGLCVSVCAAQNPPANQQRPGNAAQARRQQAGHAGDWLKKYKDLPPDQQEKALESDPAFHRLPPDRQVKLRQQLQNFRSLPPQKQQRVLTRMQTWEGLTPAQKKQARTVTAKIRQMPPERRT